MSTLSRAFGRLVAGGATAAASSTISQSDSAAIQLPRTSASSIVIVNPHASGDDAEEEDYTDEPFAIHELESSLESISSRQRGDLLDQFLPPIFADMPIQEQDRAMSHILQGVRNVLSDPVLSAEITCRARQAVRSGGLSLSSSSPATATTSAASAAAAAAAGGGNQPKQPAFAKRQHPAGRTYSAIHHHHNQGDQEQDHDPYMRVAQGLLWDELVTDHPCLICRDLLAAPVIAPCGHSFCGHCVTQYVSAVESEDIECVHTCPACRELMPLANLTYERHLDQVIERLVERVSTCESKLEWRQRQLAFKNEMSKKKRTENGSTGDDEWNSFFSWIVELAVPFVAVAVVVFMILARLRR